MSLARPRLNRCLFRNKLKIASEATLHSSCRRPRAGGRRSGAARALCLPLLLFFLFFFFFLLLLRAAVQGSIALPGYAPSPWSEKQDQSTHTKGSHWCQVRSNLPRLPTSGSLLNLLPSPPYSTWCVKFTRVPYSLNVSAQIRSEHYRLTFFTPPTEPPITGTPMGCENSWSSCCLAFLPQDQQLGTGSLYEQHTLVVHHDSIFFF